MKLAMSFSLLPLSLSPPYLSIVSPFTLPSPQLPALSSLFLYPSYIYTGADKDTSSKGTSQEEHGGSATGGCKPSRATRSLREHHGDRRQPKSDHTSERGRVQVSKHTLWPSQRCLVDGPFYVWSMQSMPTRLGATPSQSGDFPPTQPMRKKTREPQPTAPDNSHGLETAGHKEHQMRWKVSDRPKTDPAKKRTVGDKGSGKRSPSESASAAIDPASKSTSPHSVMQEKLLVGYNLRS